MLRFSLYAMTQPMQFTIFTAEILANQFESSALVAGNLYERLAGAGVDRRHLITESGDQSRAVEGQSCCPELVEGQSIAMRPEPVEGH